MSILVGMDRKTYEQEKRQLQDRYEQSVIKVAQEHPNWSLRKLGAEVGLTYQAVKNILDKHDIKRKQ